MLAPLRPLPLAGLQPIKLENRGVVLEHQIGNGKDKRVGVIGTTLAAIALRGEGAELIFKHGEAADVMHYAPLVKRRHRLRAQSLSARGGDDLYRRVGVGG